MNQPVLLGFPYDGSSSFLRGPAKAPAAIRSALHSDSGNWFTERLVNLDPVEGAWTDWGDVDVPDDPPQAMEAIREAVSKATASGAPPLSLGGDHAVTWPVVQALRPGLDRLTILHFDAHPDTYDELFGSRFSHACPFARIMEEGLADRLVQIGIRTMTQHLQEQAERFGIETHTAGGWDGRVPDLQGPIYVTIDLDAIDPAFAPGVSHHEPGGLSTRQVIDAIHQLANQPIQIVGADVVELNPDRDVNDMTAMVAVKLVKELLGQMI